MKLKHWSVVAVTFHFFPLLAYAQAAESGRGDSIFAGLLWTFMPVLLLGILLFAFLRFMPRNWKTWAPFQSPEVREICAHMTEAEGRAASRRAALYGIWCGVTFAGPVAVAFVIQTSAFIAIVAVLISVHLGCRRVWLRLQRSFFCSTAWAREQGFTPGRLRLFSFSI